MSVFNRQLSGFRFVEITNGDTLQSIAFREMGDASAWASIASLNNLLPPYISNDPDLISSQVLRPGQMLTLLSSASVIGANTDPEKVFESDLLLTDGRLSIVDGDFSIASGRANLRQSLSHAIKTRRGELPFHGSYGCLLHKIIGMSGNKTASILAAEYVKTTLSYDDRVAKVTHASAVVDGDSIFVTAEVEPISGRSFNLKVSM